MLVKPNERRYPSDSLEFVIGMLCLDVIIAGLYRPLGARSFDILPLCVLVVSQCLLYYFLSSFHIHLLILIN